MHHLTFSHCYKWKSLHDGGEGTQQDKTEDIFSGIGDDTNGLAHSRQALYLRTLSLILKENLDCLCILYSLNFLPVDKNLSLQEQKNKEKN